MNERARSEMKTIAEKRAEYELRTGVPVRSFQAYPLVGRGSVIHNWISHDDAERRFSRAGAISLFQKLYWLAGGALWH